MERQKKKRVNEVKREEEHLRKFFTKLFENVNMKTNESKCFVTMAVISSASAVTSITRTVISVTWTVIYITKAVTSVTRTFTR